MSPRKKEEAIVVFGEWRAKEVTPNRAWLHVGDAQRASPFSSRKGVYLN